MGWDPPTCVCPTSVLGAQNVPDFTGAEPEEVHLKSLTNLFFFFDFSVEPWGSGYALHLGTRIFRDYGIQCYGLCEHSCKLIPNVGETFGRQLAD